MVSIELPRKELGNKEDLWYSLLVDHILAKDEKGQS